MISHLSVWGATLIGLGMLTWSVRSVEHPPLQRAIAAVLFVANGLSIVMAVRGQGAGANELGWSMVALFVLLTLGFGALVVRRLRFVTASAGSDGETRPIPGDDESIAVGEDRGAHSRVVRA